MSANCFLDSNILVYCVDRYRGNKAKRAISIELLNTADYGISAQVMQEFYVTVTRKLGSSLSPNQALMFLDQLKAFPVVPVTTSLVLEGIDFSQRFQLSYWDGAILAAAQVLGATTLYTEDLNHGQIYGSIQVINPFLATDS